MVSQARRPLAERVEDIGEENICGKTLKAWVWQIELINFKVFLQ